VVGLFLSFVYLWVWVFFGFLVLGWGFLLWRLVCRFALLLLCRFWKVRRYLVLNVHRFHELWKGELKKTVTRGFRCYSIGRMVFRSQKTGLPRYFESMAAIFACVGFDAENVVFE
jgi:hypothetical protein